MTSLTSVELAQLLKTLAESIERDADADGTLRALGGRMRQHANLLGSPEEDVHRLETQVRDGLMGLHERLDYLQHMLRAEACLVRSQPERAQGAADLLLQLPWPQGQQEAVAETMVQMPSLSPQTSLLVLTEAQDVLIKADGEGARAQIDALGLRPAIELLRHQRDEAARLAADWERRKEGSMEQMRREWQEHQAGVQLLLDYQTYAMVLTSHMGPSGEDLVRRRRLLAPLEDVPLFFA